MIEPIPSPGDNYAYVLYDEPGGKACLIDPVAVKGVREFLDKKHLDPTYVVNTHGHGDHTNGNPSFDSDVQDVLCHRKAMNGIGDATRSVADGEHVEVGSVTFEVLHTPGHTPGSICLRTSEGVITGDTVFLAGCGNTKFGGNTRNLFKSFRDKILPLDDSLGLFPGHNYAEKNLGFVRSIDPSNEAAAEKLDQVRNTDLPTSTIGDERRYNPFFRFGDPDLKDEIDALSPSADDFTVFEHLRGLRDQW